MIDREKVVFINLNEMENYNGLESVVHQGGGRYVEQHGFGYELFNFHEDGGKCYGYTPPYCKLNLSRISEDIKHDVYGDYIDGVAVVFTCTRIARGRLVCGLYQDAKVYAESVVAHRASRRFEINGKSRYAEYNLICDSRNVLLIDEEDREKLLPKACNGHAGHGQYSVWYADSPNSIDLKNRILDYLQRFVDQAATEENEYRDFSEVYHEGLRRIATTKQIRRSREAREACIRIQGCKCNICGFDFEKTYGEIGKHFIEVHHITSIGTLTARDDYSATDPVQDLIPVCSNCHSMLHKRRPPYKPGEIKDLIKNVQ